MWCFIGHAGDARSFTAPSEARQHGKSKRRMRTTLNHWYVVIVSVGRRSAAVRAHQAVAYMLLYGLLYVVSMVADAHQRINCDTCERASPHKEACTLPRYVVLSIEPHLIVCLVARVIMHLHSALGSVP
jgi:hypothetical protein